MSTNFNIKIVDFTKSYPNKVIQIKNLSITKKVTIFVGENGSGKSTILKAISKLIKYQGTISSTYTFSYMPENPLFPVDITVEQFLYNLYNTSSNNYDYNKYLTKYGLINKLHSTTNTPSKGMKATLNLIQCLMRNTDVYILDEPLNGLDEESVNTLIKDIENSNKHFIISSHLEDTIKVLDKEIINLK